MDDALPWEITVGLLTLISCADAAEFSIISEHLCSFSKALCILLSNQMKDVSLLFEEMKLLLVSFALENLHLSRTT